MKDKAFVVYVNIFCLHPRFCESLMMTERLRSQEQMSEIRFYRKIAGIMMLEEQLAKNV